LTWLSGAPDRIGYDVAGRGWIGAPDRAARLRPRHSVENQWDLLAPLGVAPADRSAFPMEMAPDAAAVAEVAGRLSRAGVAGGDRLVVIHVSAGNPFRRWPAAHFVDLVVSLASGDPARRVVVTSGPSEGDAAGGVIAAARARLDPARADRVLSCGEFSLAELRALLDRASLYIGGDRGPLHVAATTGVPIVGLYGPTLPVRSAPWRAGTWITESVDAGELPCRPCDQRVCEPGDFRCLTSIAPARVFEAAERALAARRE
jgi:ADP-heptose:LPS heptosyltransferase